MIEADTGQHFEGVLEDAADHGGVAAFRRNQLGWIVGGELIEEEKVCCSGGFAEELDALADEGGDGEELLRRGGEAGLLEPRP